MNFRLSSLLPATITVSLVSLMVFSTACSKTRDPNPSANTSAQATPAPTTSSTTGTPNATAAGITTAVSGVDTWDSLKNYSYEQRAEFANKVNEYGHRIDTNITIAKGNAATRLTEARDQLRTAASELNNATAETWNATKDRVGRAMQSAETALRSAAE